MKLYPYVAPLVLTPLTFWLWRGDPTGWLVPILWAYIVPAIGTNVLKVWFMSGSTRIGSATIDPNGGTPLAAWQPAGAADFDLDGNTDLLWHNTSLIDPAYDDLYDRILERLAGSDRFDLKSALKVCW